MERRFFCAVIPEPGSVASLPREEGRHLAQVLRARTGEAVVLMDGRGVVARANV